MEACINFKAAMERTPQKYMKEWQIWMKAKMQKKEERTHEVYGTPLCTK